MESIDADNDQEVKPLHVAIGVFENADRMKEVAATLRGSDITFQRVSLSDAKSADDLPEIVYDPTDQIKLKDVNEGIKTGSIIGFSSGLVAGFSAIGTGFFFAAPVAGLLAGAWIGGIAGVDEAQRGEKLPDHADYETMLKEGKALLVIEGSPQEREELGNQMRRHGAKDVFQHPPLHEFVRNYD